MDVVPIVVDTKKGIKLFFKSFIISFSNSSGENSNKPSGELIILKKKIIIYNSFLLT